VFSYYSLIQCGRRIEVGDRCMFGQSSMLLDGNHRFRDLSKPMLKQGYDLRPIRIEDDVTTTTKCTIMANIGTRTVVGANSVVSRDLPAYVVAVGAPARPIDYFGPPGEEPPELGGSSSESRGATGSSEGSATPASSQAERKFGASA
jgi:acetyltransferase-like isoleucine patch superfamily enzyme